MAITFIARMAMWGAMFGGGRDNDRNPIGELAFAILAPVAAMLIQAAVSRSREFQADESAARLIGTGEPLAQALERLEAYANRIPAAVDPNQASNYIIDPLKAQARGGGGGGLGKLFSTHPPTEERVERLLELEADLQQQPPVPPAPLVEPNQLPPLAVRAPRWHFGGMWY